VSIKIKKKNPLLSFTVILLPFALLFGLIGIIRNALYDTKVIRPVRFSVPTIGIGNLVVGGTGKSPHIEYLVKLLSPYIDVASLSRGYGRKTTGNREVLQNSTSEEVGDEALVLKMKYPDLGVFVGAQRALAIPEVMQKRPDTNLILLDDIFQHRSVVPFENILLTEYDLPFYNDFLLPVGALREISNGSKRADTIIVTKCPPSISQEQEEMMINKIKPLPHQKVFFSAFNYGHPYRLFNPNQRVALTDKLDVVLFSAIAGTDYLMNYLKTKAGTIHSFEYPDHHFFTSQEMGTLKQTFDDLKADQKIILTTEKDAVRLALHRKYIVDSQLPIFILPAEVTFIGSNGKEFDGHIKSRLMEFKV
jgi:tetraacyldisaccharide 4'-kinase